MTSILIWSLVIAFIVTVAVGPVLIPTLHKLKFGQTVRDDGPASHFKKSGTPTMGGIFFILGTLVALPLIFIINKNTPGVITDRNLWAALFLFLGYGILGFADDFIKVVLKRSLGLRAKQKLLGQILLAIAFILISGNETAKVTVPVLNITFDFGYWYMLFAVVVLVAASNAVNLTDGLDGLAAGVTFIYLMAYAFITYLLGYTSLAIFAAALAGGCIGFLVFNHHPAKVFMGDTGSLALGGAVGALAVLSHTELILPIVGAVYVIETLSVILQVISFKTTGKRLFKMSPIHHHFELLGWSEVKVVSFFYTWAIIFTIGGVYLLSR
jgi:phospho-N-acetylmuramoyl-pentapeptide-transferase